MEIQVVGDILFGPIFTRGEIDIYLSLHTPIKDDHFLTSCFITGMLGPSEMNSTDRTLRVC